MKTAMEIRQGYEASLQSDERPTQTLLFRYILITLLALLENVEALNLPRKDN